LQLRSEQIADSTPKTTSDKKISTAAEERQLRKELARIERQMEKLDQEINELLAAEQAAAFDAEKLLIATNNLETAKKRRVALEDEWLQVTLQLEG
jgi:ATP-binding cassette subfamily F protein uup